MEITEHFHYLRVSSDERELALRQCVFTRTLCCAAGSRWPVSPQLDQHQSPSQRLQMLAECWCIVARVPKVYLGTTCLLVSQCYCENFCQDIWNGALSLRLHTHSCFQESLQTQLLRFFCAFSNTPPMLFPLFSVPKTVTSTTGL